LKTNYLQNFYSKNQNTFVAFYAAIICFLTYAVVYAFRKPFTIGTFALEPKIWGIQYKDALVISQVLGYASSKFYGIRFISALKKTGRGKIILLMVLIAWLSLLLFAIVPSPWNILFLFINGFPLGMIWGIVFSYVEGRKATDFIGATLAVSFIFSSGFVKSVAKWLMIHFQITEHWIPFFTGLVFILPLLLLLFLLEKIPTPTEEDIALKVARPPMDTTQRKAFFAQFRPGLILLIIIYVFLTIFRDIRDNFAADIWKDLGFSNQPAVFTNTEIPITIIVLILISSMMLIQNNRRAFLLTHYMIIGGFLMAGISSFLFVHQLMAPFTWMTLVGLGLYIGYIPFNCILFDRMIATFKSAGNVGFLMYIADSFGYLGSVGVILAKTIFHLNVNWTVLYSNGVIGFSVLGILLTILALYYFINKDKNQFNQYGSK
jgi:MFS family permease